MRLLDRLTEDERRKLAQAINWASPRGSEPAAGSEAAMKALTDMVDSLGLQELYQEYIPRLERADFSQADHPFAHVFKAHVKDALDSLPAIDS